jgi:glycosyltransferase involved in cell wall biosynthesis
MRAELLRNGFDENKIEIFAPVPKSASSAGRPSFGPGNRLVYSGQIVRGKGVDILLRSLARVRSPFECLVFGDGRQRASCEMLSRRLGLTGKVRFLGFVPQAELAGYFVDATAMVMSSVWPEPFGATGLEAMRHGLPVVAFDAGGIKEWLVDGSNGFLVPWMDQAAFANRVDLLLEDKPLARRMGEAGRTRAAARFGFESYIEGLEILFSRITVGHHSGMAS